MPFNKTAHSGQAHIDTKDNNQLVDCYQVVVGTVVLIQNPLPVTALARLTGRNTEQFYSVLRKLQSVILLGSDDVPRVYHRSFVDFVTDSARCRDISLQIDPMIHHTRIVKRCFTVMDGNLRYNILGLDGPARFMDNKEGLAHQGISDGQVQEKIPSELRYACVHWANHLEHANIEDPGLMKEFEKFADVHMLHWVEALSLIGQLDSAHRSIRVALKLVNSTTSDLFRLLSDQLRFISKFYEVIERSSLHTYYSTLP